MFLLSSSLFNIIFPITTCLACTPLCTSYWVIACSTHSVIACSARSVLLRALNVIFVKCKMQKVALSDSAVLNAKGTITTCITFLYSHSCLLLEIVKNMHCLSTKEYCLYIGGRNFKMKKKKFDTLVSFACALNPSVSWNMWLCCVLLLCLFFYLSKYWPLYCISIISQKHIKIGFLDPMVRPYISKIEC